MSKSSESTAQPSPSIGKKGVIATLQAGRAIAALLVVLYHNGGSIFALDKYWGNDPLGGLFEFGSSGVMFFFVLSGFIILHVHWNDLGVKEKLIPYFKKRFVRIYPIYWIALVPLTAVYFIVPSFGKGHERDFLTILSSALLVHMDSGYTIIGVAWTLYHEILFYLVFALLIFNKRAGMFATTVWFAATIVLLPIAPAFSPREFNFSPLAFYFSPLHLLFAMGMGLCWIVRHDKIPAPKVLAVLGSLAFFAVGLDEDYSHVLGANARALAYGLSCAIALAGFIELERQKRISIPKTLVFMGDASYSIYLAHFPVLSASAKIFCTPIIKEYVPLPVAYVLLPVIAVLAGIALHRIVEKPLLNKLGKVINLRKR